MRTAPWLLLSILLLAGCASAAPTRPDAPAAEAAPEHPDPDVQACVAGEYESCFAAKSVLLAPGADPAVTGALRREWQAGCRRDVGLDCFRASLLVEAPDESLLLTARACQTGFAPVCETMGSTLVHIGLQQNSREGHRVGVRLLERGCELRDASSCRSLGELHANGDAFVPRDRDRGRALVRRACDELDDEGACASLVALECKDGLRTDCPPPPEPGSVVGGEIGGVLGGQIVEPPSAPPAQP